MSRHNKFMQQLCFWSVLLLAVTAESWMDLVCKVIFQV